MDLLEASKVEKELKEGLEYKKSMGFTDKWPEYERFKAGDQWPPATERTRNLPRPVFNIIDHIESHKIASIQNEHVKILFSAEEVDEENPVVMQAIEAADKFNAVAENTWENIDQDKLNEEVLDSASNIGTGIVHYYWDNSVQGGITTRYIGDIKGETIDPMNFFPGDPQMESVQKQPYILITSREFVSNVRDEAKRNGIGAEHVAMIRADKDTEQEGYDNAKKELSGSEKVTVITKYFKKNGTVHFMRVCSGVIVKEDTDTYRKLYPIAKLNWKQRKKSFFGVGDTEGLIPNQKGINFLLAMMLKSVQDNAWPKLLAKEGALLHSITNTPGEVIIDRSMNGDGVKYLYPGQFSNQAFELVDKFVDYTKLFSAAQDASTGDMNSSNLNASAIMLLQKAAGVPIEGIRKRFYRYIEDIARIWEDFFKTNYNTTRTVSKKDINGKEEMTDFRGEDFKEMNFSLKVDIGPASGYSESLSQSVLDNLFGKQAITLKQYIEYSPKSVIPFKDKLLKEIEEQEQQAQQQGALQGLMPEEQAAFQAQPPEVQQQLMQGIQAQ